MSDTPTRLYLLDVEGTVAPLTLVSEQLFPFARSHVSSFLNQNSDDPKVSEDLVLLAQENRTETESGCPTFTVPNGECSRLEWEDAIKPVVPYLTWLMDRDRKSTALKSLQGKIWKAGFESGELKGTLFADVPDALSRWITGARVAIYSSGSVEAQKLLFRHSVFGDLTPLIAAYFDTRTGPKAAGASYGYIAASMGIAPAEVLFFSDVVRELDAAREAGCQTRLVVRQGNAPVDDAHGHAIIDSLQSA